MTILSNHKLNLHYEIIYLSRLDGPIRALMSLFAVDKTLLVIHWSDDSQSFGRSRRSSGLSAAAATAAAATGGHRRASTREARKDPLELLAKVVVEPGVEEDVVACRRHGHRVRQKAISEHNQFNF